MSFLFLPELEGDAIRLEDFLRRVVAEMSSPPVRCSRAPEQSAMLHPIAEVKTTDVYRLSLETTAGYRRELIKNGAIPEDSSSILYVVGRSSTTELEAQVRGSRHAWDIRLISVDALFGLVSHRELRAADRAGTRLLLPGSQLFTGFFHRCGHTVRSVFT